MNTRNFPYVGTATLLFAALFYRINFSFGLNWFVFLSLIALATWFKIRQQNTIGWFVPTMTIFAGLGMFLHCTGIAVFACILSLLMISATIIAPNSGVLESLVISIFNLILSPFRLGIDLIKSLKKDKSDDAQHSVKRSATHWLIPIILVVVFVILYYNSSPAFRFLIDQFDWTKLVELMATLWIGLLISHTAFRSYLPQFRFRKTNPESENKLSLFRSELRKPWSVSMALLSLLLGFVVFADLWYRFYARSLPPELTLSEYVHQGVFSLVISILLATFLSVRLNTSDANAETGIMRYGIYSFLILNCVFVIQNIFRNSDYINHFGLTEKRIAVYFYLAFCFIALIITFIYLGKKAGVFRFYKILGNTAFALVVAASLLNWSVVIVNYNLKHTGTEQIGYDFDYMLSLNRAVLPLLIPHEPEMSKSQIRKLNRRVSRNISRETRQLSDIRGFVWDHYQLLQELKKLKPELVEDALKEEYVDEFED
ncbi:MAG: DUF4173 domain-containing protein [Bacteroidetes bacterium]|nr:DUF4173 domain-containing protein [Bacteroidota bacterium]